MGNWEDLKSDICIRNFNYIENCWAEFLTLTEEEEQKLYQLYRTQKSNVFINFLKKKKDYRKLICVETKKIYNSINELAAELKKTRQTLSKYIKLEKKFMGKTYKYI